MSHALILDEIEVEYNGEKYSTNYHDLLNVKENERKQARQSWQSIANIKDLKWVILMVLFNIPGCENAYQQMEELLFEVNEGMLH